MYSIRDFYIFLKLGIWKTAIVDHWGKVSLLGIVGEEDDDTNHFKTFYFPRIQQNTIHHRLLVNNVYFCYFTHIAGSNETNEYYYLLVLKVIQLGIEKKEKFYYFKITNQFRGFVIDEENSLGLPPRRRKWYKRRERNIYGFGNPRNDITK